MNQHDWELLDKQVRRLGHPPKDGSMILMVVAGFIASIMLGGVLFSQEGQSMRLASNDVTVATPLSNRVPPATPQ